MNRNKKILFVFSNYSSFVEQDFKILSKEYSVDKFHFLHSKKAFIFFYQFIRQFFLLVLKGWKYDAFFIWFADYHSLLPVLFAKITGRKSYVVIGGYDVCRIQSLKYGAFYKKYRGVFTIQSIKNSTLNLTVSKYVDTKIKFIAPKANKKLVYNCFEFNEQVVDSHKENLIITVGSIGTEQTFYLKGIDTFIETAKMLPAYSFRIIGLNKYNLRQLIHDIPPNLTIVERLPHNELALHYQHAKIYCQFSRSESFGISIVEAMSFGCIPIVTNEGGMPEIVGDKNQIIKKRDPELISLLIVKNIENYSTELSINTPQLNLFTMKHRGEELLKLFNPISN
jgi:glycosyltransferase involved in cell wall biosynthesis